MIVSISRDHCYKLRQEGSSIESRGFFTLYLCCAKKLFIRCVKVIERRRTVSIGEALSMSFEYLRATCKSRERLFASPSRRDFKFEFWKMKPAFTSFKLKIALEVRLQLIQLGFCARLLKIDIQPILGNMPGATFQCVTWNTERMLIDIVQRSFNHRPHHL